MIKIRDWEGMKYPDEYLVRAFYKEKLFNSNRARCLELGCSSGINLTLFAEYGYDTLGVDISSENIKMAERNFVLLKEKGCVDSVCDFLKEPMKEFFIREKTSFDAILFPSSLYYQRHDDVLFCLNKASSLLSAGGFFFFHMRNIDDYRYLKTQTRYDDISVKIDFDNTGEKGCNMSFYSPITFAEMVKKIFKCPNPIVLKSNFENLQNGEIIKNSDFIIWGFRG